MTEIIKRADTCEFTSWNYREMRTLDADVASRLGWSLTFQNRELIGVTPSGDFREHLRYPPEMADAEAWIDKDDEGLPFYAYTMNGAMRVLVEVLKSWGHAQQNYFWDALQRQATFDTLSGDATPSLVPYPSVLSSLIDDLPAAICRAYIKAWDKLHDEGENTHGPTRRAELFRSTSIEQEGDIPGQSPKPTSAPWVHRSEDDNGDSEAPAIAGAGDGGDTACGAIDSDHGADGSASSTAIGNESGEGYENRVRRGEIPAIEGQLPVYEFTDAAKWEEAITAAIAKGRIE